MPRGLKGYDKAAPPGLEDPFYCPKGPPAFSNICPKGPYRRLNICPKGPKQRDSEGETAKALWAYIAHTAPLGAGSQRALWAYIEEGWFLASLSESRGPFGAREPKVGVPLCGVAPILNGRGSRAPKGPRRAYKVPFGLLCLKGYPTPKGQLYMPEGGAYIARNVLRHCPKGARLPRCGTRLSDI